MDTFRKWLNKPKADDKSLLARFYHADRSLTAVASELDSFDGRAEPDRCSRLVSRLRQSQDKVLAITNLIMEELLGEDRDPRSFRAKFPEEVLQENLAGQLWFGAECLAAGSSIMNREQESKEMRPLAQAVTKSLGNVRNLLRDQCLRHNVPNSKTLHLDLNDTTTEQLCESLKIFDRLFAEFELRYVSAMVQVKTKHEHEMQELICVLFSETLQRALKIGLLEQDKVDAFDPALMFSIPRLAIIAGLVIYHKGPLNMDMAADLMSEMFRPFRTILIKIRDLLRALNKNELYQLERLLCTNEDIHLTIPVGSSSIEAPSSDQQNNNNGTSKNSNNCDKISGNTETTTTTSTATATIRQEDNNNTTAITTEASTSPKKVLKTASGDTKNSANSRRAIYAMRSATRSPAPSISGDSSIASTPSVSPAASPTPSHSIASTTSSAVSTSTTSPTDWTDEDDDDDGGVVDDDTANEDDDSDHLPKESDIVAADCASGYLIPNTNFGNLLQPQEVPLTDNFIDSEDEFGSVQNDEAAAENDNAPVNLPSTSTASLRGRMRLPHIASSEESEQLTIRASTKSLESCDNAINGSYGKLDKSSTSSVSKSESASNDSAANHRSHRHHHHRSQEEREQNIAGGSTCSSASSESSRRRHQHSEPHRHHHHHHHHHHRHCSSKTSKRSSLVAAENDDKKDAEVITTAGAAVTNNTSSNWSSKLTQSMHCNTLSPDASSTSSSLSDGDPREGSLALRPEGRQKFKSTENLLHRLFVCIAGVADQLQTNFAADLRQILRSVFLMNMSPTQEDIDIPEKTKDSELFEFRASENDVIQESAGSNQSIYSAEEVNPELDNVFNNTGSGGSGGGGGINESNSNAVVSGTRCSTGSNGIDGNSGASIQRVHTIDLGTTGENINSTRNHIGRSRSLGDHENSETISTTTGSNNMRPLSSYISGRRRSSPQRQQTTTSTYQQLQRHRNRNNSTGSNSPTNSSSSSESNSPVIERVSVGFPSPATRQQHLNTSSNLNTASASTTAVSPAITNNMNNINNNNNNSSNNNSNNQLDIAATPSSNARLAPPAWIPDDKAPRCMSCHTPFTAFRRRHHCRNCGGVFCGVCSNSSAPLPKYGLTKAVRVCRNCYVREVRVVNGAVNTVRNNTSHATLATSAAAVATTTAGGS